MDRLDGIGIILHDVMPLSKKQIAAAKVTAKVLGMQAATKKQIAAARVLGRRAATDAQKEAVASSNKFRRNGMHTALM